MLYMKEMVDQGFCGDPYIYNAYEQNSQWIDPQTPLRQGDPEADQSRIHVSSLEGYGAPVIDIARWMVGSDFTSVVGVMRNFVPERDGSRYRPMMRMNIDDGDIFIAEFANGAIGSVQSSFVTVGNFPGDRGPPLRSEGRHHHPAWSRNSASPRRSRLPLRTMSSSRNSRSRIGSIPKAAAARDVVHPLLRQSDQRLPRRTDDGHAKNQGNFDDGAWVQEIINAVEISHHERRWTDLPLPR